MQFPDMRLLLLTLLTCHAALPNAGHAGEPCIEAPYDMAETALQRGLVDLYGDIRPVLSRFPDLAQALRRKSPTLCYGSQMDNAHGYLDVESNRIVLSQSLARPLQIGILLHELRHLWQFSRDVCPSIDLAMKEYARATFAIEADASAISLLVAWDMKENGDDAVWTALSDWPSHADIADSFAETMLTTGDRGLAVTAAFYQWYASADRHDRYYAAACSDYLAKQEAGHLIPRYQLIEVDFFENLCRLPGGGRYRCSDPGTARD